MVVSWSPMASAIILPPIRIPASAFGRGGGPSRRTDGTDERVEETLESDGRILGHAPVHGRGLNHRVAWCGEPCEALPRRQCGNGPPLEASGTDASPRV